MNSIKLRRLCAAVSGAMLMGMGANAMADSTDDIINALVGKGVLTEEEGALLMRGRTGEKEAADEKKKTAISAKFKDGIVFESGDGNFSMAVNGRVHADYRAFDYEDKNVVTPAIAGSVNNPADTFDIRRARLGTKFKWGKYYEAEVVADLANTTTLDVGYLNIAWWKPVQFRMGQFKMPMNLEELTSSNNIDFMERSYVNQLAPTKEIGGMVHGSPFTGTTYALALSNGALKNAETDVREDGKDVIGRVTANFAEIMGNKDMVLHAGASFSKGDTPEATAAGVAGRTEARGATFFTAPIANSSKNEIERTRAGIEGVVAYNQFKLQSEWMKLSNEFETTARKYDVDQKAWYAEALWMITGEKYADSYKSGAFGAIKPKSDFDPVTFKGGAWEIGARYSKLDASDYNTLGLRAGAGTDADITTKTSGFGEAKAFTLGIKFLPTANTRLMLNYVKTDFDDIIGTTGLVVNNKREDSEKAIIMRAQWMF
jgi:phosphate-selective porin OprO/OprP